MMPTRYIVARRLPRAMSSALALPVAGTVGRFVDRDAIDPAADRGDGRGDRVDPAGIDPGDVDRGVASGAGRVEPLLHRAADPADVEVTRWENMQTVLLDLGLMKKQIEAREAFSDAFTK